MAEDAKTSETSPPALYSEEIAEGLNKSNNISSNSVPVYRKVGQSNISPREKSESKTDSVQEDDHSTSCSSILNEIDKLIKADSLHQLTTSALPQYTPGSPPKFYKKFGTHPCYACGDVYAIKASLVSHLNRRSILIKFPCDACKNTLIFYNRCKLLIHARAHHDKNEKSDIKKATVSVLPRILMDGIHREFINTLDDDLNTMDITDDKKPNEMFECSLQEFDESELKQNVNEEKDISFAKVKCLDCNEEFDSPKDRREHLTNSDKISELVSRCNICGLLCPSKCSLNAHRRIHNQASPYVCPECGETPDPRWTHFLLHVNYECFHSSRVVVYKCPICKYVEPSNDLLLKHMELHTVKYAKCSRSKCSWVVKCSSLDAFPQHYNTCHNGGQVYYTIIYKCPLCDEAFVSEDKVSSHAAMHLKGRVCEYVFKCIQCGKFLESKSRLKIHIVSNHHAAYLKRISTGSAPTKPVTTAKQYRGTVECIICSATFYNKKEYSVHLSKSHINVNKACSYCFRVMRDGKCMVVHGKMHLEEKAPVCLLCNNLKFVNLKDLDAHLENHVRRLKFFSFCPICDTQFSDLQESLNHLRFEHYLPLKVITPTAEIEKDLASSHATVNKCYLGSKSFGKPFDLRIHFRHFHNVNESSTSESAEQAVIIQRKEGNSCAKCDFKSSNREEFKQHIRKHKGHRSTYQCQECGRCYVVESSLLMHLIMAHKIRDGRKYIAEEGTNYMPELENPDKKVKADDLECSVCFTSFPNDLALKRHMRSHGLAFIQANKTGEL